MSYHLPATALMQIKHEKLDNHTAKFVIEPLSPGFGLTIGNSLRRVLLSSLEGAAITSIRIDGVSHEYSSLKGVREDIVDVILNLKKVRLQTESSEPVTIILDSKKEGAVKAGEFKCPTGTSVINDDFVIANLSKGAHLLIEATVERGRGYQPTEMRKEDKLPIGVMAIDAAFSPVEMVNFEIENTRVGKMTNYDKLTITVSTDGTMDPQVAMEESAAILVEQLSLLTGSAAPTKTEEATPATDEVAETTDKPKVKRTKKTASVES